MCEFRYVYNIPLEIRHLNPSENSPNRVKCHKIVMIYPQPVRRHHHLDTTGNSIEMWPPLVATRNHVHGPLMA